LTPDAPPQTRSALQAQLRKDRKNAARHRHRWRRRILLSLTIILLIGVVGAGGLVLYATYRFDQIKKVDARHLIAQAAANQPFNLLLVGSDSRAFVENATQVRAFGSQVDAGGQRSDVTMVARFVPATKTVTVLSIPRDLWVDIPTNKSGIEGMNRINSAFDSGPDLLVQTVEKVLRIPVNHYMSVDFPGFSGMVDALGGITMNFTTEVRDAFTGLNVRTLGCQVVNGTVALQLVRSRHLQYVNTDGNWEYDGLSDFSRIRRQDAFFRAVLAKVNASVTDPVAINGFISAAVGNVTIDSSLSQIDLLHIAENFKGLASSHLVTETLPTTSYTTGGGAAVLLPAQPYADDMISAFNRTGMPRPRPKPTSTPTIPAVAPGLVDVQVLNASSVTGIAHATATALTQSGFQVVEVGDAPKPLAPGSPSQIWYGPTGLAAAHSLGAGLSGSISYVPDPSLSGNTVTLFVAGSELTVNGSPTTTTTTPTGASIPADVYTNTQPEPWNPVPCTLGASTRVTKK